MNDNSVFDYRGVRLKPRIVVTVSNQYRNHSVMTCWNDRLTVSFRVFDVFER